VNIAHKGKLTPALLHVYLIQLPNKYSQLRRHAATSYVNTPPPGTPSTTTLGYSLGGYLEPVMPPLATSTRRLCALCWQRPSRTLSEATSSRSRHLWLRHHAPTSYVDTPPSGTLSTTILGYSLGGYLEPVTPPLATSSRCYQLCRHAAFRHYVGNDPRVLPRGLPRAGHATSGYDITLPPAMSTFHLLALIRQQPSGMPSVATPSRSHHLYLRWPTASAYIIDNDPQVRHWQLPQASHGTSIYGGTLPPPTSSATILGYALGSYPEPVTPPLFAVAHCLRLHRRQRPSEATPSRLRHLHLHRHAAFAYIVSNGYLNTRSMTSNVSMKATT
jgi:hypothetical protein